jgi:hypothetical protein
MAHWNLYDQACGQNYDATRGCVCCACTSASPPCLHFVDCDWHAKCASTPPVLHRYLALNPKWNKQDFQCFVTVMTGWGQYTQKADAGLTSGTATLAALYGSIELNALDLPFQSTKATATMGGTAVPCTFTHGALLFTSKLVIPAGSTLTVTLSSAHIGCLIPAGSVCCPPKQQPECCPPGTDCSPALRQRCCPSTEKAELAKQAESEQLQDSPNVALVVMPTQRRSNANVCLVLLIGVLIGMYLPVILRFLSQLTEGFL